jgi:hypothetical protein
LPLCTTLVPPPFHISNHVRTQTILYPSATVIHAAEAPLTPTAPLLLCRTTAPPLSALSLQTNIHPTNSLWTSNSRKQLISNSSRKAQPSCHTINPITTWFRLYVRRSYCASILTDGSS